jgi:myo-inositol-1(or 4)-monophosphatase
MFFIARAAEPMLPGWLVRTRTNRIGWSIGLIFEGAGRSDSLKYAPRPAFPEEEHMHPMLNTAVKAARRAGAIINRATLNGGFEVQAKRANDFVTEVDKAAEAAVIDIIRQAYPDHAILAEESGENAGGSKNEYTWVIDPLDGTTNFIHGFPQYCVSIGVRYRGQIAHAVIYDPVKNELFVGSKGRGAFLNDRRVRVTKCAHLRDGLIGTGFPFKELDRLDLYMKQMRTIVTGSAGIRRAGAAALDLAYVACGRLDGFWEMGLSKWDMAAGALLIKEAGGLVGGLTGEDDWYETGDIVAATPKVFVQLLDAIK